MSKAENLRTQILDTALRLADDCSWEVLRLHRVADELDIPLTAVQQFYRQKDDLVEAWYDRADMNMLQAAELADFLAQDKITRIHRLIMAWLDSLAKHKKVSADMLLYKLEPGHIHLQTLGILRISRTVQWFLEAAQSNTRHLSRITEEFALTSIYLLTFTYWINDHSENQQASRKFLMRRLKQAGSCTSLFGSIFTTRQQNSEIDIKNNAENN